MLFDSFSLVLLVHLKLVKLYFTSLICITVGGVWPISKFIYTGKFIVNGRTKRTKFIYYELSNHWCDLQDGPPSSVKKMVVTTTCLHFKMLHSIFLPKNGENRLSKGALPLFLSRLPSPVYNLYKCNRKLAPGVLSRVIRVLKMLPSTQHSHLRHIVYELP